MHGIQLTVQMCSKRPLLPVCMRYRMVWYYSSFASKPMKIDERYGFITICWQWDQSTYLFLLSRQSQWIELFSEWAFLVLCSCFFTKYSQNNYLLHKTLRSMDLYYFNWKSISRKRSCLKVKSFRIIHTEKVPPRYYEVRSRKWTSLGRKKRMVGKATGKNKVHWSSRWYF